MQVRIFPALGLWMVLVCAYAQGPTTVTIGDRTLSYVNRDGLAVTHGDIILGTLDQVQTAAQDPSHAAKWLRGAAVYTGSTGEPPLWPNATLYYTIDSNIPDPSRITDAIAHWTTRTSIKFAQAQGVSDYVRFVRASSGCSSYLGVHGGEQAIQTGDNCSTGSMIHEIGHALGLEHEHERRDRNLNVTVQYEYLDKQNYSNFDQFNTSRDLGYYDYDSIMHYPAWGSTDNYASIETVPVGIPIGQRNGLSAHDIDAIQRLYGFPPTATVITTMPEGLPVTVDGVTTGTPVSFPWEPGSTHTISAVSESGTDPKLVFNRWTDGGAQEHTLTASADHTVFAAIYQRRRRFSSGTSTGNGTVSVLPEPPTDSYFADRQLIRLKAAPVSGSDFFQWTGSNTEIQEFGMSAPQADMEMFQTNSRFFAQFGTGGWTTIDSQPTGQVIYVDSTSYLTPVKFAWTSGSTHTLRALSSSTNFIGDRKYLFQSWNDGVTTLSRTIAADANNTTYSAAFRVQYHLAVTSAGNGVTDANPPASDGFYDQGSTVQVTATPGNGLAARYWTFDAAGGGTTKSIVMNEPKLVGVSFGQDLPFRPYNAASYAGSEFFNAFGTSVAPLEIVTLFGDNLGPGSLTTGVLDTSGRLSTSLGGTRVLFDGTPAPIVYASSGQTSVVVPANVAGKSSTTIRMERDGIVTAGVIYGVSDSIPGLFTSNGSGKGPVAALNQDGSINSASNPAARGSVVVLYATGAGTMDQTPPDGTITGTDLARPAVPVYVRFERNAGEILYAGSAPYFVLGALQVNVRVPMDTLPGEVPVTLITGNAASPPGTTIFVQ